VTSGQDGRHRWVGAVQHEQPGPHRPAAAARRTRRPGRTRLPGQGLTGTSRGRPGPNQALAAVRTGDTFTVTKLDRLARPVPDALDILTQLSDHGVAFARGGSVYDWADPFARMFLQILAVIAEFEANFIRQRTRGGMAIARDRGKLRGKPPKLTAARAREVHRRHASGDYTIAEIGELFSVSQPTIYRALQRTPADPVLPADPRPLPNMAKYDGRLPGRAQHAR
jgi:DNA invertase Pin-like site-specific DNA recombinase